MNLAIEYLVRTGAIRRFFHLPQTLFLQNQDQRLVVSIDEEVDRPDFYHVIHWDLSALDETGLPRQQHFSVPKSDLFSSSAIVIPKFYPIVYQEQPLDTSQNEYNHPMSTEAFDSYVKHYLNSRIHQATRSLWLWHSFAELFFNRPFAAGGNSLDAAYEHFTVQHEYPDKWDIWRNWKGHMLPATTVAGELIFESVYQMRQQRFSWF
jgi:hypothetical protein